jgi:hypothetical protein
MAQNGQCPTSKPIKSFVRFWAFVRRAATAEMRALSGHHHYDSGRFGSRRQLSAQSPINPNLKSGAITGQHDAYRIVIVGDPSEVN